MTQPESGLSLQMERLKRLLREAGLDPERDWDRALETILSGVDDAALSAAVKSLLPAALGTLETIEEKPARPHEETFQRFNLSTRIQHGVMAVSVIILIITGLPLKFHEAGISTWFMDLIGGVKVSSVIHRVGATGLIAVGIFHLWYIAFTGSGRRDFLLLLPALKDAKDYLQMVWYYLGRRETKPKFGRFSYVEKFDYWAVYWGMVIMISSGSLLWFQDFFLKFFPKFVMDIANEAHSDEALLATLAIIIWHFYNVHFTPSKFPISKVFIHGRLTRHEMEEEHPLELEEIERLRRRPAPRARLQDKPSDG